MRILYCLIVWLVFVLIVIPLFYCLLAIDCEIRNDLAENQIPIKSWFIKIKIKVGTQKLSHLWSHLFYHFNSFPLKPKIEVVLFLIKSLHLGNMVIIMTTICFPVFNLSPNNYFLKILSTKKKWEKKKRKTWCFPTNLLPKWFTKYLETLWKINFRTKSLFMTGFWSLVPFQNRGI